MIEEHVTAHVVSPYVGRYGGTLRYDAENPLAVTLVLREHDGEEVPWEFARELLAAGTERLCGIGDVVIWPSHDPSRMKITITSPDGDMTLMLDRQRVITFLRLTYTLVPRGTEAVDVQSAIDRILA